ncbi:TPA: glycosyltransferase family 2 protein, partial [Streptococcus suis]|nr:glycosyltransferase family 2 protein [Streptococcus suis]
MAVKKVAILVSTYNGERYLLEQLESLFHQEQVEISIFLRDDCSSDTTVCILERYREYVFLVENNNINLGVGNSFMEVLYEAEDKFDYYAFCDQDDIWQPEKLKKAIEMLSNIDGPALYCSNQTLVNQDLEFIGVRTKKPIDVSYKQILTNNKLTGCTMVWNNELQKFLIEPRRRPAPELLKIRIHDVWVGMVASVVGNIVYDTNSYILYRQHENNVVGVRNSKIGTLVSWYKKITDKSKRTGRSFLAKEISGKFGDIVDSEILLELELLGSYRDNFKNKIRL